jgi:uncharacterized membrane protein (DUF2068 family)
MTDSQAAAPHQRQKHNKVLILIALYKGAQALLFAAVGFGALRLLHQDVGDVLSDLATALRFSPESRLVNFIVEQASFLDDALLRRIGVLAFSYSAISLIEGVGLYFEKAWAEILTLLITGSFLPWEIFEVFRRVTWLRVELLAVNALVFFYLLNMVTARRNGASKTTVE